MTDWPDNLYPVQQSFYIRPVTITFQSDLTGQFKATERAGSRWIATLDFKLTGRKSGIIEALIARLRGPVGSVAVPDLDALPEGGLGLYMMRALMDEVDYQSGNPNVLCLTKRTEPAT